MTTYSLRQLRDAMTEIADRRKLEGVPTSHRGETGVIEGIAHELAHQLEAGRNFDRQIRDADDEEANKREMRTLRIEVAALRRLGKKISLSRLWLDANWRLGEIPDLVYSRRPLSYREARCVDAFVQIVERAMGDLVSRAPTGMKEE